MKGKQMSGFPGREKALADFFAAWEPPVQTNPFGQTELVPLVEAVGRVTATDLYAVNTLPVSRSSACDGIAVDAGMFVDGIPDTTTWRSGCEYERADTGDDFEDRFNAVIPIEEVVIMPDSSVWLSPDVPVAAGWNVHPRGELLKDGDLIIRAGMVIRPMDLASFAAGGIARIPVRRKPRVAFIPTGNELVPAGVSPKRGQNVDTNSVLLEAALQQMGAKPLMFPIVRDDPELLKSTVEEALTLTDLVILNGGTAKGGEDYNFQLLEKEGRLIHHYIAAAPGRPMALAVVKGKPVINLPGPTVAAVFGLEWCVNSVVARLSGIPVPRRPMVNCVLTTDFDSSPHMAMMCLMRITKTTDGVYQASYQSFFDLSLLTVLSSNGLYISEVGEYGRRKGEVINVALLRGEEYMEAADREDGGYAG